MDREKMAITIAEPRIERLTMFCPAIGNRALWENFLEFSGGNQAAVKVRSQ